MLSVTHTVFLMVAATISNPFPDTQASRIDKLDIPLVVRNNTGPIDLSCVYYVRSDENGLVIKWYHNMDQIYQWIPPMPPQDAGVINGLVEYPEENLKHPNLRSVIRLRTITAQMSGEYTCTISTFQETNSKRSRMIVYVPETDATIYVSSYNETHMNLTCVANGAQPRPILKFYVEGLEVVDYYDRTEETKWYRKDLSVKRTALIRNTFEPILLDCEISIPRTNYKRRERIVYYPGSIMVFRLGNFTEYYIKAENAIAYALRMKEATVAGGGLYLEVAVLGRITTWSLTLNREGLAPTYCTYTLVAPNSGLPIMKMNCTCVMLFLAICALWTFGETLSCDQCGRECADICGTRQFRACCFNNMKKRQYNIGLKLWMRPRRYRMHLYPVYDMQ